MKVKKTIVIALVMALVMGLGMTGVYAAGSGYLYDNGPDDNVIMSYSSAENLGTMKIGETKKIDFVIKDTHNVQEVSALQPYAGLLYDVNVSLTEKALADGVTLSADSIPFDDFGLTKTVTVNVKATQVGTLSFKVKANIFSNNEEYQPVEFGPFTATVEAEKNGRDIDPDTDDNDDGVKDEEAVQPKTSDAMPMQLAVIMILFVLAALTIAVRRKTE